jgi:2,3-diketo-5-methylthio-1-phosphopentane phosphatase
MPDAVLVSDFDGTITTADFYRLATERLLSPDDLAPWMDYRAGRITHLAALQTIFSRIRASEAQMLDILRDMRPDPELAASVARLRDAGWSVVVASAGCLWYIRRLLDQAGVDVEVHGNPGSYRPGGPLVMDAPTDSPFYCPETGVDKAAVVRFQRQRAATVAFVGDGYTDLPAALLVPPERRFARGDLAEVLSRRGQAYRPFTIWSDVARSLLADAG